MRSYLSVLVFGLLLMQSGCVTSRHMPEGLDFSGPQRAAKQLEFLADRTWLDENEQRQSEQQIFDAAFAMIAEAKSLVLLDMFLFNPYQGAHKENHRALSGELTAALIAQKQRYPALEVVVITDPVNTVYGGLPSPQFEQMRGADIRVIETNLPKLPDSNPAYSMIWRTLLRPFGNAPGDLLPNPIGEGRVSLRSYLALLNFKANHRKTLITDSPAGLVALVTSANPHDGSSAHDNVALKFMGNAVVDLLNTERAVLALSNQSLKYPADIKTSATAEPVETLQVLTEGGIRRGILAMINAAEKGDRLDLSMFYLSERAVVSALAKAQQRGVIVRALLDPNKDAFGRKKNGIPNRQTGAELEQAGASVRWCDTFGEQCHAKLLLWQGRSGEAAMIVGSANFTRRNINNLNLETSVLLTGNTNTQAINAAANNFEDYWSNRDNKTFSTEYSRYEDTSMRRRWMYRFMEWSGISTF